MTTNCECCGRPVGRPREHGMPFGGPAGGVGGERLYFVHDFLGCDTGCCGHRFYVVDKCGRVVWSYLMLAEHRWDTLACQAGELARRFGVVVDWRACDHFGHGQRQAAPLGGDDAAPVSRANRGPLAPAGDGGLAIGAA